MSQSQSLHFEVNDMTCNHCVKAISSALKQAFPTAKVTIDLGSHDVAIEGPVEQQAVADIIEQEGYTPTLRDKS